METNYSLSNKNLLIFVPTYNEAENIGELIERIQKLKMPADILIVDDNSTDGTSVIAEKIVKENHNVTLIHRRSKLGIGSAHLLGIQYAYDHGYKILITMDADFSHSPEDIPLFINKGKEYDIVVGTRFENEQSLKDWSLFRKILTHLGHFLTRTFLQLPFDTTGGFRFYNLEKINRLYFNKVASSNYEFFFESLAILHINKFRIAEVPIDLPKRVYGHSKMKFQHVIWSLIRLFSLSTTLLLSRNQLTIIKEPNKRFNPEKTRNEWDSYWSKKTNQVERKAYDLIAKFYRFALINPNLKCFVRKYFKPEAKLLHAGCGGGEVDVDVVNYAHVTAIDISPAAIKRYNQLHLKTNKNSKGIIGNIMKMDMPDRSFDGIYNLGVMEHFQKDEIIEILKEMSRLIKPDGKLLLFWPPSYGLSVLALHAIHFILNRILRRNVELHPQEPSKIPSKRTLQNWLNLANLELEEFSFSVRDAFTYVVVVASKRKVSHCIDKDVVDLTFKSHIACI